MRHKTTCVPYGCNPRVPAGHHVPWPAKAGNAPPRACSDMKSDQTDQRSMMWKGKGKGYFPGKAWQFDFLPTLFWIISNAGEWRLSSRALSGYKLQGCLHICQQHPQSQCEVLLSHTQCGAAAPLGGQTLPKGWAKGQSSAGRAASREEAGTRNSHHPLGTSTCCLIWRTLPLQKGQIQRLKQKKPHHLFHLFQKHICKCFLFRIHFSVF